MKLSPLLLTLALIGCKDKASDTASDIGELLDDDHDGYVENLEGAEDEEGNKLPGGDCNDEDPLVHPAAVELCDTIDNDCDDLTDEDNAFDAITYYYDSDGDGFGDPAISATTCTQTDRYVVSQADCDDANALANPNAEEVCDDADNDCDGNVDEGTATDAATWYLDSDNDGYGTEWKKAVSCDQPEGYVHVEDIDPGTEKGSDGDPTDFDCDDGDPEINPAETEICDDEGKDEDCDGLFNDDDSPVLDQPTWYADTDDDQYGDPNSPTLACEQPFGYEEDNLDCDDTNNTINPGENEECGNGVDDNCDDAIDDNPNALYWITWIEDNDTDGYGDPSTVPVVQCAEPAGYASNTLGGDCDDTDINTFPGATEIWYDGEDGNCDGWSDFDADEDGYDSLAYSGTDCDDFEFTANPGLPEVCDDNIDNDCDNVGDPCETNAAFLGEFASDQAGYSVSSAGDWTGDGIDDMLVGAINHPGITGAGNAMGAIYVIPGDLSISGTGTAVSSAATVFYGAVDQDHLGTSVAALGSVDGDSYGDILMGAADNDYGGSEAGVVYLHYGPEFGAKDLATSSDIEIWGETGGDKAGTSVANAGDVDGDGETDMVIGAPGHGGYGSAYLLLGPVELPTGMPVFDLSFANTRYDGVTATDNTGVSVAGGGDLTADGLDDLLIGANNLDVPGYGKLGGAYVATYTTDTSMSLAYADARLLGASAGEWAGYSVAIPGDVNGDGYDDALIGAPESSVTGTKTGVAYLVQGPLSGDIRLGFDADATFYAEDTDAYVGTSVAGAGDIDGNGQMDLLIGARQDDFAGSEAGAAYVMLAPLVGDINMSDSPGKLVGNADLDNVGYSVAPAGDVNLDGVPDILVGANLSDDNDVDAGAAYLILGGGW